MVLQARGPGRTSGLRGRAYQDSSPEIRPAPLAHVTRGELSVSLSRFLALHAELCDDWRIPSPDWFAKLGRYACLRRELTRGGIDVEVRGRA